MVLSAFFMDSFSSLSLENPAKIYYFWAHLLIWSFEKIVNTLNLILDSYIALIHSCNWNFWDFFSCLNIMIQKALISVILTLFNGPSKCQFNKLWALCPQISSTDFEDCILCGNQPKPNPKSCLPECKWELQNVIWSILWQKFLSTFKKHPLKSTRPAWSDTGSTALRIVGFEPISFSDWSTGDKWIAPPTVLCGYWSGHCIMYIYQYSKLLKVSYIQNVCHDLSFRRSCKFR